jgi:hypothetical protein
MATQYVWDGTFTDSEIDALEDGIMLLDEFTKRDGEYTPDYEFPAIKHMRSALAKMRASREVVRTVADCT